MNDRPVDFSIIGEITPQPSSSTVQSAELVGLETNTLAQEKTNFDTEQLKQDFERKAVELDKLKADVTNAIQDIGLRRNFSGQILRYLWSFSAFCAMVLILQGFHVYGFNLETPVLVTLVGGTAASAFGLVSVALGGLFRQVAMGVAKEPIKSAGKIEQKQAT